MNAYALHVPQNHGARLRWSASAILMAIAHGLLILVLLTWLTRSPPPGIELPVIMIDMAPAVTAPSPQQTDIAPDPQTQQADPPPPATEPPAQATIAEPIAPTPPQDNPLVAVPPEQSLPLPKPRIQPLPRVAPEPPKQAPVRVERTEPKPDRVKKPAPTPAKQKADKPALRAMTAPSAERQGRTAASPAAGAAASAAALPGYRQLLAAHIRRFQQYPPSARASGQQGTAMLSMTVGRGGQLLGSRLARSSGVPALDAETMAMIRRAQPLPPFPAAIQQSSLSFSVPVGFAIR